jgi:hypothetical protein
MGLCCVGKEHLRLRDVDSNHDWLIQSEILMLGRPKSASYATRCLLSFVQKPCWHGSLTAL